jgi:hypothetical protein
MNEISVCLCGFSEYFTGGSFSIIIILCVFPFFSIFLYITAQKYVIIYSNIYLSFISILQRRRTCVGVCVCMCDYIIGNRKKTYFEASNFMYISLFLLHSPDITRETNV